MLLVPLLLATLPPRVLIVGGGPNREYNQAAIESNVRYVAQALPKGSPLRVLFADGEAQRATVRYSPAGGGRDRYRRPQLARIDGAALPATVGREIGALARGASPILLYFTGHGSLAEDLTPDTSEFDLWRDESVTVPDLARLLAPFPKTTPIVVLMVQCHAGGFAKLLFPDGDPKRPPLDNRLCGFFASIEARPAAGCTAEIDEAEYRDFTGYFVAALTGRDRVGRLVTGADANHDGRVGMDEAFCWSMVHDDSIDTPVCTSDELLRAKVGLSDAKVFATPYRDVLAWASSAQRAALEAISARLRLQGEDRLATAFGRFARLSDDEEDEDAILGFRFLRLVKSVVLGHALLSQPDSPLRHRYVTLLKDEAANPFRPPLPSPTVFHARRRGATLRSCLASGTPSPTVPPSARASLQGEPSRIHSIQ